jgi:hypothetical protein
MLKVTLKVSHLSVTIGITILRFSGMLKSFVSTRAAKQTMSKMLNRKKTPWLMYTRLSRLSWKNGARQK